MWSGSKVVNLEINDAEVELTMVLDDNGMAHFPDGKKKEEDQGEVEEEVHEEVKEQIASRRQDMMRKVKRKRSMSSGDMSMVELGDQNQKSETSLSASHRATSDGDLTDMGEKEAVFDDQDEQEKVKEKVEKNTLRLSKEEMEEIGLRLGGNSVVFSVTTRFQGTYR